MELLCAALGRPQDRFRSLHVVGTNGKTSVTQMCAALLGAGGLRAGACISPHVWRWSERVRIGGEEIGPQAFAAAVERVAAAVERVQAESDERVTQFEAAIAACFVAFAAAGVEVAVVEAGLGGRLDATNVIASEATALTSVGLDHVQWLGETELEIATEKLAVLEPGSTLITGRLSPEIAALAARTAQERGARLIDTGEDSPEALPGAPAPAPYLGRDAAVAIALAETVRGPLDRAEALAELGSVSLPGRAEILEPAGSGPPLILDAAHNEQGAAALAEALPALAGERPVFACLSILADKDAPAFAAALAPALAGAVCTAADPGPAMGRPGARAAPPETLASLLSARGVAAERRDDPDVALERAVELARERGGVALCAGSHYLLRYAWKGRNAPNCSR